MSIPKIIHYCWFGPNPIPKNEKIYIENWKVKLPEYRFVFWNEESFDVQSVRYVKQAYDQGKYAFVSDYVRIYALNKYGGIYLDTDVEVLKDFSPFLDHNTFLGFENRTMVGTGIIGTQKNNPLFLKLLRYYNSHDFINKNGVADTTTNVKILNKLLVEKGLTPRNSKQIVSGIHIYDRSVFCPKKKNENEFLISKDSVTIHHFDASWLTERERKRGNSLIWRNICRPFLRNARNFLENDWGRTYKAIRGKTARQNKINHKIKREVFLCKSNINGIKDIQRYYMNIYLY